MSTLCSNLLIYVYQHLIDNKSYVFNELWTMGVMEWICIFILSLFILSSSTLVLKSIFPFWPWYGRFCDHIQEGIYHASNWSEVNRCLLKFIFWGDKEHLEVSFLYSPWLTEQLLIFAKRITTVLKFRIEICIFPTSFFFCILKINQDTHSQKSWKLVIPDSALPRYLHPPPNPNQSLSFVSLAP